ncbi:plasmid mobilization protein [Lactobacillus helveticus]
MQVRVSPDEKKQIQKLADQAHLSMSSFVRNQLLSANGR